MSSFFKILFLSNKNSPLFFKNRHVFFVYISTQYITYTKSYQTRKAAGFKSMWANCWQVTPKCEIEFLVTLVSRKRKKWTLKLNLAYSDYSSYQTLGLTKFRVWTNQNFKSMSRHWNFNLVLIRFKRCVQSQK